MGLLTGLARYQRVGNTTLNSKHYRYGNIGVFCMGEPSVLDQDGKGMFGAYIRKVYFFLLSLVLPKKEWFA